MTKTIKCWLEAKSALILPTLCAPQGKTPVQRALVNLYPATNYGEGEYYVASGEYPTYYSIPANLEKAIKSLKFGPDVMECHMFKEADRKKVKGKYKVYAKDEPNVTLYPILFLECARK